MGNHWEEYLPYCNSLRRPLASSHPWQHRCSAWTEGEHLAVTTLLAKDIFLHGVVYTEGIPYGETVNESLSFVIFLGSYIFLGSQIILSPSTLRFCRL